MLETPKKTLMKIAKTATDRQIFPMPPRTVRRTLRGGWQEVCRYAMPVSSHAHARVVIEETRRACSLGCSRESHTRRILPCRNLAAPRRNYTITHDQIP